jgi:hypothetical protein
MEDDVGVVENGRATGARLPVDDLQAPSADEEVLGLEIAM